MEPQPSATCQQRSDVEDYDGKEQEDKYDGVDDNRSDGAERVPEDGRRREEQRPQVRRDGLQDVVEAVWVRQSNEVTVQLLIHCNLQGNGQRPPRSAHQALTERAEVREFCSVVV